jgi:hypothetical protein
VRCVLLVISLARFKCIYIMYAGRISRAAFPFANLEAARRLRICQQHAGRKEVSVGAYVLWDVRNVEIMTHCVKMASAHITLESERERKAFFHPKLI